MPFQPVEKISHASVKTPHVHEASVFASRRWTRCGATARGTGCLLA